MLKDKKNENKAIIVGIEKTNKLHPLDPSIWYIYIKIVALDVSAVMEIAEVKTDMEILHGNVEPHNHTSKEIVNTVWSNNIHQIIKQLNAFLLLKNMYKEIIIKTQLF